MRREEALTPYRIYVDTSVIGGCLEPEFSKWAVALLDRARRGNVLLLVSEIVLRELAPAPPEVRAVLDRLPLSSLEEVPVTVEVRALREAYIAEGVVGPRRLDDAGHVAAASIARADAIASWNLKHIVHIDRIKGYQRVNLLRGYGILTILSPRELADDDEGR